MGLIAHDEDAKQIRDMAAALYEQGKSATYILDAIDSYAVGAGLVPSPTQGAVDALHAIAACTHQDVPEPGSWWDLVSEIHGMARRGLDAAGGQ